MNRHVRRAHNSTPLFADLRDEWITAVTEAFTTADRRPQYDVLKQHNLTWEEAERRLYADNDPRHATFMKSSGLWERWSSDEGYRP